MKKLFQIFGVLIFVAVIILMGKSQAPRPDKANSSPQASQPITKGELLRLYQQKKRDNRDLIHLRKAVVRYNRRTGLANGSFTIANKVGLPIKDVIVLCEFFGNSGTRVGSRETTLYELIKTSETKTTTDLSLGFVSEQFAKYSCDVSDYEYATEAIPR